MKNKLLVGLFVLFSITLFSAQKLSAQVSSESNSTWIGLSSYSGSTTSNAFRFSINLTGRNINHRNWSLVVRANYPITNPEGKTIDPSKIRIRINKITAVSTVAPTLAELGTNQTPIPLSLMMCI